MKKKVEKEIIDSLSKNPNNWKGVFYVNHKDPRIIVPKINPSFGWTLNFGHKVAYIGIIIIVLIIVAYQVLISIYGKMQKISIPILIIFFIVFNMNNIQAQINEPKLNQVELIKKFIGSWKGEFGDNSIFISENKPFANGIISNSQITTNGKVVESVLQLYGYDSKTDKFIIAELKESSSVIEICSVWFTSLTTGEIIITNPKDAPFRFVFEFKSPDTLEQTAIQDNKVVNKISLTRQVVSKNKP